MKNFDENENENVATFCGFVGLVGKPNVGKSTLLNYLLGQKVSITSRKPQTTRRNLLGVDTIGAKQAIYVDTPGLHRTSGKALNKYMVKDATSAVKDVDILCFLTDCRSVIEDEEWILGLMARPGVKRLAIISKIDLLRDKQLLLPKIKNLRETKLFSDIFPVSALRKNGLSELRSNIFELLPSGTHLFPDDQITDKSERFLASEIVREKIMRQLGDEIPHCSAVIIESFSRETKVVRIRAQIVVERDGQKRVVIGKSGDRLKKIGTEARKDLENLLNHQVMLHLWVKVKRGWTNNSLEMGQLGYD